MLSPEQVVEIAESLKSPVMKSEDDDALSTSASSSFGGRLSRSSSGRRHLQRSGSGASLNRGSFNRDKFASEMSFTTPEDERRGSAPIQSQAEPMELEPVEYVEMGDDVFLPYVDRPSEVAELFEHPSNVSVSSNLTRCSAKSRSITARPGRLSQLGVPHGIYGGSQRS